MNNSIEIYRSQDGSVQLNVKLENETVWLNRQQMAELFGRDYKTVSKHINNALHEELEGEPVVAKFATPKNYGRVEGKTQAIVLKVSRVLLFENGLTPSSSNTSSRAMPSISR